MPGRRQTPQPPADVDGATTPASIEAEIAEWQHKLARQLARDLAEAATALTPQDVRLLIDLYYQIQRHRIRLANTVQAEGGAPVPMNKFMAYLYTSHVGLEHRISQAMEKHTMQSPPGRWLLAQYGIGPILAAGLLAYLLPGGVPETVGHWWRLGGQDPTSIWYGTDRARAMVTEAFGSKRRTITPAEVQAFAQPLKRNGQRLYDQAGRDRDGKPQTVTQTTLTAALARRPWNAHLKVALWKLSTSMVKFHGRPQCYYGHIWARRKAQEVSRNEAGLFAAEAARQLREKRYGEDTEARRAYEQGKLPAGHLQARAQRYCAKFFLSHLHYVCHDDAYGKPPPVPWPIAFLDQHQHFVPPPGWPLA